MKQEIAKMTEEEMKEGYSFLFRKVMEDKAKGLSSLALSFRETAFQNGLLKAPSDLFALDILCYFSFANDETPWKGRECALEALSTLEKAGGRFLPEEALSCYELLLLAFSELEDAPNEWKCAKEASFYAFRCGKKEDAFLYMKRHIDLCFRFPKEEWDTLLPNYETLVLMFGKEKAKELLGYSQKGPYLLHDPIETNPLFVKALTLVNQRLKDYFVAHPSSFSRENYEEKKKAFLLEEGFAWAPAKPLKN